MGCGSSKKNAVKDTLVSRKARRDSGWSSDECHDSGIDSVRHSANRRPLPPIPSKVVVQKAVSFEVKLDDNALEGIVKRHRMLKRGLEPLEAAPKLTYTQLEDKMQAAEKRKAAALCKRVSSASQSSRRRRQIDAARSAEMTITKSDGHRQLDRQLTSAEFNRENRLKELKEKQRLREERAARVRARKRMDSIEKSDVIETYQHTPRDDATPQNALNDNLKRLSDTSNFNATLRFSPTDVEKLPPVGKAPGSESVIAPVRDSASNEHLATGPTHYASTKVNGNDDCSEDIHLSRKLHSDSETILPSKSSLNAVIGVEAVGGKSINQVSKKPQDKAQESNFMGVAMDKVSVNRITESNDVSARKLADGTIMGNIEDLEGANDDDKQFPYSKELASKPPVNPVHRAVNLTDIMQRRVAQVDRDSETDTFGSCELDVVEKEGSMNNLFNGDSQPANSNQDRPSTPTPTNEKSNEIDSVISSDTDTW